jgi:fructose-1,6-bisphosphatase I
VSSADSHGVLSRQIYSFNEGNSLDWDPRLLEYLRKLKTGTGMAGRRYDASYIGALVADVHRIITMGGVYGYPGTDKTPNGKIRLLYEANPISMLVSRSAELPGPCEEAETAV